MRAGWPCRQLAVQTRSFQRPFVHELEPRNGRARQYCRPRLVQRRELGRSVTACWQDLDPRPRGAERWVELPEMPRISSRHARYEHGELDLGDSFANRIAGRFGLPVVSAELWDPLSVKYPFACQRRPVDCSFCVLFAVPWRKTYVSNTRSSIPSRPSGLHSGGIFQRRRAGRGLDAVS